MRNKTERHTLLVLSGQLEYEHSRLLCKQTGLDHRIHTHVPVDVQLSVVGQVVVDDE